MIEMFPDHSIRTIVRDELSTYGQQDHEREGDRVRLAILKVAGTSLDHIQLWLATAKKDYRDVLASAEYPKQLVTPTWRLPATERHSVELEDAAQYYKWIRGPS